MAVSAQKRLLPDNTEITLRGARETAPFFLGYGLRRAGSELIPGADFAGKICPLRPAEPRVHAAGLRDARPRRRGSLSAP